MQARFRDNPFLIFSSPGLLDFVLILKKKWNFNFFKIEKKFFSVLIFISLMFKVLDKKLS